jgi:hypothetical protein
VTLSPGTGDEPAVPTVEVPLEPEVLPPHGRRSVVLFAVLAVVVVGMVWGIVTTRLLKDPVRGDVVVDSVVAIRNGSGSWDTTAVWSAPAPGGCVVLGWQVQRSDRGFEVASQQMAPSDAVFPAVCASPSAAIVLEHVREDPVGQPIVVNGKHLVVTSSTGVDGYTTG